MIFEHRAMLPATVSAAWDILIDIPAIGVCIPGVDALEPLEVDRYRGTMTMKIGAIRLRFEGTIAVAERDRENLRARLEVQGADRRIGGSVSAKIDMVLEPVSNESVQLVVRTDTAIMGKLGELGQAVIRKKADQVMTSFAANVAAKLNGDARDRDIPGIAEDAADVLPS